ncbi:MAG TPA: SRPBCC domain-containing protein [Pseudonocardiaceae bacterium]
MSDDELVVRTDVLIAAPPEKVWEVLVDLPRYRDWHPSMTLVSGMGEDDRVPVVGSTLRLRARRETPAETEFEVTVTEVNAPSRFTWQGGAAHVLLSQHRWTLVPEAGGTRVVEEQTFEGPMGRQVFTESRDTLHAWYVEGQTALKKVVERGQ